jgi:hypothetical protein
MALAGALSSFFSIYVIHYHYPAEEIDSYLAFRSSFLFLFLLQHAPLCSEVVIVRRKS